MTQEPIGYIQFKLYYPDENAPEDQKDLLGIHAKYEDVKILATFKEGSPHLQTIINHFPNIIRLALKERDIQEEIRDMGAEIDKLLGDSE